MRQSHHRAKPLFLQAKPGTHSRCHIARTSGGVSPRSRSARRLSASVRLASRCPLASRSSGQWCHAGGISPSARYSRICRAVDFSRSAPRTTSVIRIAASSTTHGKLVCRHIVTPPHHEVAKVAARKVALSARSAVFEADLLTIGYTKTPVHPCRLTRLGHSTSSRATATRIYRFVILVLMRCTHRGSQLTPRTTARIYPSSCPQPLPGVAIESIALTLPVRTQTRHPHLGPPATRFPASAGPQSSPRRSPRVRAACLGLRRARPARHPHRAPAHTRSRRCARVPGAAVR